MAVPKKKVTQSRRNMRRAHDSLKGSTYQECPDTGALKRPHHICLETGYYKGKKVIKTKSDLAL